MSRFLTRDRVWQSLEDGVFSALSIFSIDLFLMKWPIETALEFGIGTGVVTFVLRIFTRPSRMSGPAR